MDKEKQNSNRNSNTPRNSRVKHIKICIIIIALVLLIMPTILCIVLFFRLNIIQKQIDILMIDRYGVTYSSKSHTSNETVAHAATIYKSSAGGGSDNLNNQTEDKKPDTVKPSAVEENTTGGYNINKAESNKDKSGSIDSNTSKDDKTAAKDSSLNKNKSTEAADGKKSSNTKGDSKQDKDTAKNKNTENDKYKDFDKKTVYITFDDGPSKYTEDILKILADYNVKATFFVIGKTDAYSKKMYKEILKQGHALGMHSYSHDYNKIYKSAEDFDKDFTKIRDLLYDTTGYLSSIYRFPGGSSSSVMKEDVSVFINYLNQKSVVYFDWNVVSGDATGVDYTPKQLYDNVINGIKLHNRSIVLMHDTDMKENSVKSLKMILKTLTEQGVKILPLNEKVTPIQQVKSSSIEQKK